MCPTWSEILTTGFPKIGAQLILWRSRAAVMMGVKIELEWKNKTENEREDRHKTIIERL